MALISCLLPIFRHVNQWYDGKDAGFGARQATLVPSYRQLMPFRLELDSRPSIQGDI